MKFRTMVLVLLLSGFALPASAQGIAGKWNASAVTDFGEFALTFNFMIEAGVLKGTMSNDFTGDIPIADGMIDGDEISFKLTIDGGPGGAMVINYKGVVEGNELKLTSTFEGAAPPGGGADQTLTATRAE